MRPLRPLIVLSVEHVRRRDLALGTIACDDIVPSVSVEIAHTDLMSFRQIAKDDVPLPVLRRVLRVDHYLVSVPWLNRGHDPLLSDVSDRNVTGAGARSFLFVSFR